MTLPGPFEYCQCSQDAQEGGVEKCSGKHGRYGSRCFGMGVGKPGVEGRQAHFCTIAGQDEHESQLQPQRIDEFAAFLQVGKEQ